MAGALGGRGVGRGVTKGPVQEVRVRAGPTYVILDRAGVIRRVHEGIVDQESRRSAGLAVVSEGGTGE